MTGRDETAAQARAFLVLLDELRAGKLTADTSKVLLATASANLHELLTITDRETAEGIGCHICGDPATSSEGDDLYCAGCGYPVCPGHDAGVAGVVCDLCKAKLDAGLPTRFPAGDAALPGLDTAGLAPADALPMIALAGEVCDSANPPSMHQVCTARHGHPEKWHALHGTGGRVLDFWPVADDDAAPAAAPPLPWECYSCGAATGVRCWSGFTHGTDRPACETHSSLIPGLGTDRECADCAQHRAAEATGSGAGRPPEWVCVGCEKRFPGAKPGDGRCIDCVPPVSLALVHGLAEGGGE